MKHLLLIFLKGSLLAAFFLLAPLGAGNKQVVAENDVGPLPVPVHLTKASWYDPSGRHTARGKIYAPDAMFAAHQTCPFGTLLKVTNLNNHLSVIVSVQDRGPFVKGRGLDLTLPAARALGMVRQGVIPVSYAVAPTSPIKGDCA